MKGYGLLVMGYWLLVIGYGLLVIGYWLLVRGTLEMYTHGRKDQLKRGGWFA